MTAIAILFISGEQPPPGADFDQIVTYLNEGERLRGLNAGLSVGGLLPLALFFAGVLMPFRTNDRNQDEGWAAAILIGFIGLSASIAVHEAAFFGLSYRGAEGLSPGLVGGLWDIVYVTGASAAFAMTVITFSTTVPVLRHEIWPRWHGWLSILIAILGSLAVIDFVTPATAGAFSGVAFLGFTVVWVLATSVLLWKSPKPAVTNTEQAIA